MRRAVPDLVPSGGGVEQGVRDGPKAMTAGGGGGTGRSAEANRWSPMPGDGFVAEARLYPPRGHLRPGLRSNAFCTWAVVVR